MRYKSFFAFLAALAFAAALVPGARGYTYEGMPEVDVRAEAALLADADTGEHLFEKNIDERREPASLTKIMTCLLTLEMVGQDWDTRKDELVTVPSDAFYDLGPDSSIGGLTVGEQIPLKDLLYMIMLQSANEGCNALAVHMSGSVAAFVEQMNRRAQELNCAGTVFSNPHGLHQTNHYTTARDMYAITAQAMKVPRFMEIVHTSSYTVPATNKSAAHRIVTTNKLIDTSNYSSYYYPPAKGIKTGYTGEAGLCLASTAEKDNLRLVSIVLGAEVDTARVRHFVETKLLFEWGFENFVPKKLLSKTEVLAQVNVLMGIDKDFVTLVPDKEIVALVPKILDPASVERKVSLDHPEGMYAPIYSAEILGTVTLEYEGHVYGTVNLLANYSIAEDTAAKFFLNIREWFSQEWIKWTLGALATLLVFYIALTVFLNARRRREKNRRPGNYRGRRR